MRRRLPALAVSFAIAVVVGCARAAPPTAASGETSDGEPGGGGARGAAPSTDAGVLSEAETEDRISRLREFVVPPVGTTREAVDGVYGEPRVEEFRGTGNSTQFPMHFYELLPPAGRSEFRARLYVTYRSDRVFRAAINHMCVVKNRMIGLTGSRAQAEHEEILAEQRRVLIDLDAIHERYRAELVKADWARQAPAPDAATDAQRAGTPTR